MALPQLNTIPLSRDWIETFGGYNHNLKINEAEWYDMQNMSSDDYPLLANRTKRGLYTFDGNLDNNIQGMIEKDSLWFVKDDSLYRNFAAVGIELEHTPEGESGERQLVSMGAYLVIFPDGVYVNTINTDEHGRLGNTQHIGEEGSPASVRFTICNIDGEPITLKARQGTAPTEGVQDLDYWLDTSGTTLVLKRYAASSSMWVSVVTPYLKISATGISQGFEEGDGVTISGINTGVEGLDDLNNTSIIWTKDDIDNDYIVVIGIADFEGDVVYDDQIITLERKIPDMDYVCESGNRLWGCKYGTTNDGKIVNEIYACKLGDFKNWNVFAGVSTDSYTASCGTDGKFTGCISYLGYPLFFKDEYLHKVYGAFPAQYQIQQITLRGVQDGCDRSLVVVDETLFYKSRTGVMAFQGSLPTDISGYLGKEQYDNAAAGAINGKYYVSMRNKRTEQYDLFVYDIKNGLWHREDNTHVKSFCTVDNRFYMATADTDNRLIEAVNPNYSDVHVRPEPSLEWYVESGKIGLQSPDKKYLSRLDLRMSLELGAVVRISVQYDSIPKWEHLTTITGTKLDSFSVPIRPKRCDHMRLRIEGRGNFKVYSMCKTMEQGSDK